MLARATMREKEFALRVVLGAGRARLIRLVMVEPGARGGRGHAGNLPRVGGLRSLVAAMPPGVIPAWSVDRAERSGAGVHARRRGADGAVIRARASVPIDAARLERLRCATAAKAERRFRGRRLRDAVVVAEVALSLTLLIGAGLLMRSFAALRGADLGVRTDHVFQTASEPGGGPLETQRIGAIVLPAAARAGEGAAWSDGCSGRERLSTSYSGGISKMEIAGMTHGEEWLTLFQHVSEDYFRSCESPSGRAGRSARRRSTLRATSPW